MIKLATVKKSRNSLLLRTATQRHQRTCVNLVQKDVMLTTTVTTKTHSGAHAQESLVYDTKTLNLTLERLRKRLMPILPVGGVGKDASEVRFPATAVILTKTGKKSGMETSMAL